MFDMIVEGYVSSERRPGFNLIFQNGRTNFLLPGIIQLIRGVRVHGIHQWTAIKAEFFDNVEVTAHQLKVKWDALTQSDDLDRVTKRVVLSRQIKFEILAANRLAAGLDPLLFQLILSQPVAMAFSYQPSYHNFSLHSKDAE